MSSGRGGCSRAKLSSASANESFKGKNVIEVEDKVEIFDSDSYESETDESDEEMTRKTNQVHVFLKKLDETSLEEIKQDRLWSCPVCHNGHARRMFKGLQALMNHAKSKGEGVRVHRKFAEQLEEQLRIRGTFVNHAGEYYGVWRGLKENVVRDRKIVWPPIVIIRNTSRNEKDDNGNWLGMGNHELLQYFSAYNPIKACHSYGPDGHQGTGLLIFEASVVGYLEANELCQHLDDEGIGRQDWEHKHHQALSIPHRQLYGYLAKECDMDYYNQLSRGSSRQKFEMRSYQEVVIGMLKKMSGAKSAELPFGSTEKKRRNK